MEKDCSEKDSLELLKEKIFLISLLMKRSLK